MVKNKIVIIGLIVVSLFAAVVGSGVADGNDPYADEVYSFTQGYVWDTTKSEPPGTWGYTDAPEVTLGGPTEPAGDGNAYFVSLGSRPAGEIILKFVDSVLIDGQENSGYDLAIYEFGAADDAHVYLSNDRSGDGQPDGWIYLGYTRDDATLSRQTGDHPDYITGDSSSSLFLFDVAGKLDSIGGWASFIRIVDDDIGRKDPNFTDGFDLNAVELLSFTTLDELNTPEEEENTGEENQEQEQEQSSNCYQGSYSNSFSWNQGSSSCNTNNNNNSGSSCNVNNNNSCSNCNNSCKDYKEIKESKIHYKYYDDKDCCDDEDDDEAWVWGKVHLATPECPCCWDEVTITVGSKTETVRFSEKDKKKDKWEYKRSKYDKNDMIKKIKIDWKKGKFDIYLDKTCVSGTNIPPVITVSGEGCTQYQSTSIEENKGHWWGYDFSKSFKNFWKRS